MRKERSFGIIPLRRHHDDWEVLLVRHGKGHWAFPKGHAELRENPQETASRELFEETGLRVVRFLPFEPLEETYFFTWEKERIHKTVLYFLAEVEGEIRLQDDEISDHRWLSLDEAEKFVTFPEARRILRTVKELLLSFR